MRTAMPLVWASSALSFLHPPPSYPPAQIEEGLRARIAHLLKQVHSGLPAVLQQLPAHPKFGLLTDENRRELEQAISS
eukprot:scaffold19280_cov116-Isochrysis_galbana.AAC.2